MKKEFFPDKTDILPTIYAYQDTNPQYAGMLKVGYTTITAQKRVAQQYPTLRPGVLPYNIVLEESAMKNDGSVFMDHEVHGVLQQKGFENTGGEWFRCGIDDVLSAILDVKDGTIHSTSRSQSFGLRPEQAAAIEKTKLYLDSYQSENPGKTPHFLWNAKMRFGKTFTTYKLAKEMGWSKILVMTFKPAVEDAWDVDLNSHTDFEGWQFVSGSDGTLNHEQIDESKPFVCFGSFQNFLGKNSSTGGVKVKNEWVHNTQWDCVVFDEYHYGAWRDSAKDLFEAEDKKEQEDAQPDVLENFNEKILPITTNAYLYLSGTPFRAISSGEFIEEQIYNWTYSDEQKAKENWDDAVGPNPYAALPRMVMMTYQLPDAIREIATKGEFNEFDLNTFFTAKGGESDAQFEYEDEVQKWLDLIRGSFSETQVDNLKLGAKKPPMPFSHTKLLNLLNHTLWFLPSVASCFAMKRLLAQRQNVFYQDYTVVVAAGTAAGIGINALPPVLDKMRDPLVSKTITLSCGKLMTGVTVKPWAGIFMLRSCSTPETYFQAAFRVQSPWSIKNPDSKSPNKEEVIKNECYIFDFAPNRALRQVADYGSRLQLDESNPETKVAEFIQFLPVLAYDGSTMKQIDAAGILDIAMSGTSATLLARRWESALLVNVDNDTLKRLMADKSALDALMSIEGFRNLNQDIETIINKSESIEKTKKEKNDADISKEEKEELTADEKETKGLRKQIQEKLIKFATRIPVFMYLTDYRERALKDVISQLEPELFKKVTGLTQRDFEVLAGLGVFNSNLMNDAIYKFKRYEDASLSYAGIDKSGNENVGGWDTVITSEEFSRIIE